MQFLFFFLIMVGIWGCHLSHRPPRKVIQIIELRPAPPEMEAPLEQQAEEKIHAPAGVR